MKKLLILSIFALVCNLSAQAQEFIPEDGVELCNVMKASQILDLDAELVSDIETADAENVIAEFKKNRKIYFDDDFSQGKKIIFYQRGNKKIMFELILSEGCIILTPWTMFGEEEGHVLSFYMETSMLRTRCMYSNGVKNGDEFIYFPDGRTRSYSRYINGEVVEETNYAELLQVDPRDIVSFMLNPSDLSIRKSFEEKYKVTNPSFTENNDTYRYSQSDNDTSLFIITFKKGDSLVLLSSYNKTRTQEKRGYEYVYHVGATYLFQKNLYVEGHKKQEKEFYQNGVLKRISHFGTITKKNLRRGFVKDGDEINYRNDGTKLSMGYYYSGGKHGDWIQYEADGLHPKNIPQFEFGILVGGIWED